MKLERTSESIVNHENQEPKNLEEIAVSDSNSDDSLFFPNPTNPEPEPAAMDTSLSTEGGDLVMDLDTTPEDLCIPILTTVPETQPFDELRNSPEPTAENENIENQEAEIVRNIEIQNHEIPQNTENQNDSHEWSPATSSQFSQSTIEESPRTKNKPKWMVELISAQPEPEIESHDTVEFYNQYNNNDQLAPVDDAAIAIHRSGTVFQIHVLPKIEFFAHKLTKSKLYETIKI